MFSTLKAASFVTAARQQHYKAVEKTASSVTNLNAENDLAFAMADTSNDHQLTAWEIQQFLLNYGG